MRSLPSSTAFDYSHPAPNAATMSANFTALRATVSDLGESPEVEVASAGSIDIGVLPTSRISITGTTTVTSLGTNYRGVFYIRMLGALTFINSTVLQCPYGVNLSTMSGDILLATPKATALLSDGWVLTVLQRATASAARAAIGAISSADLLPRRNEHSGFILSTAGGSASFAASEGYAADSTNTKIITLTATRTKNTAAFVQGDTLGGLTTGAIANNTTYYPFAIERTDTGFVDICYDTNQTTPNLSAANLVPFTLFRRLPWAISTNGSGQWLDPVLLSPSDVAIRQTVLRGPVDSNGIPNFGGATLSTTVTATGTLVLSAANGHANDVDRVGVISNPSWTGLNTNGTRQLFLEIAADGTCTTSHSNLFTIYQRGGAYSNTNGQHVFNINEMQMRVGNGASNSQVWRVPVGEVTIAGGVVTAIRWYAIRGQSVGAWINTLPGSSTLMSFTHNLGLAEFDDSIELQCLTAEFGYSAGEILSDFGQNNGTYLAPQTISKSRNTATSSTGPFTSPFGGLQRDGGAFISFTAANWAYRLSCTRRFR